MGQEDFRVHDLRRTEQPLGFITAAVVWCSSTGHVTVAFLNGCHCLEMWLV